MGNYNTAQICLNGHLITDDYERSPGFRKNFCPQCGQSTIIQCPACNSNIQGNYKVAGVISLSSMKLTPAYCYNCGKPYPWTESNLKAIAELIELDDQLGESDKNAIKEAFPYLLSETPKTPVAVTKFNIVMRKAGKVTFDAVKEITLKVVSEAIRKSLFGI